MIVTSWIYSDIGGGFNFTPHSWRSGSQRMEEVQRHRDEAYRRMAVCRLSGLYKEAKHWKASARFFENKYPELFRSDDGSST